MRSSLSIGTDLVDVARIGRLIRNKKFLARIFTPEEIRYCRDKKHAAQHFAVRFAAKEAVWKSLATVAGLTGLSHRAIGVGRSPSGQPFVQLSGRLKKYEPRMSLSLSHTHEYALAVAVYLAK
jgi:holo-[acyl-carrier protein] synthase